jgi:hypothetical protein
MRENANRRKICSCQYCEIIAILKLVIALPFVVVLVEAEHPKEWSVGDTMQWLAKKGLARYAPTFADHNVDGALLLQLTSDDLRNELGIQSLGDRRKLQLYIKSLQDEHRL